MPAAEQRVICSYITTKQYLGAYWCNNLGINCFKSLVGGLISITFLYNGHIIVITQTEISTKVTAECWVSYSNTINNNHIVDSSANAFLQTDCKMWWMNRSTELSHRALLLHRGRGACRFCARDLLTGQNAAASGCCSPTASHQGSHPPSVPDPLCT